MTHTMRTWIAIIAVVIAVLVAGLTYDRYEEQQNDKEIDKLACEFDPASC